MHLPCHIWCTSTIVELARQTDRATVVQRSVELAANDCPSGWQTSPGLSRAFFNSMPFLCTAIIQDWLPKNHCSKYLKIFYTLTRFQLGRMGVAHDVTVPQPQEIWLVVTTVNSSLQLPAAPGSVPTDVDSESSHLPAADQLQRRPSIH